MSIKKRVLATALLGLILVTLFHRAPRDGERGSTVRAVSCCTDAATLAARVAESSAQAPCPKCAPPTAQPSKIAPVPEVSPAQDELWARPAPEGVFADFKDWTARYEAAAPDSRPGLTAEGVALARERQRRLADMITTNPQRALELAAPVSVRKALPAQVTELLEEIVNTRAAFTVAGVMPVPGNEETLPPMIRSAQIGGLTYGVYTYGPALSFVTKKDVPVNGIALPASATTNPVANPLLQPDKVMALNPSPVRLLENAEVAELVASPTPPLCPTSGNPIAAEGTPAAAQVGGTLHSFCGDIHLKVWTGGLVAAAALATPDQIVTETGPVARSNYTEGSKRFLFLRVDFPDATGNQTLTDAEASNLLRDLAAYEKEMSYGKLIIAPEGPTGSAFTPIMRMPQNAAYYDNAGLSRLYPDARTKAAASGYNLNDYQFFAVFTRGTPAAGYAGLAYVGGIGIHMANGYFGKGVTSHELGHNLGLPHAHSWNTSNKSMIGDGTNEEYGNGYDPIGGGAYNDSAQYVGSYKNYLDWILDSDVPTAGTGLYRLYEQDEQTSLSRRTLRVTRNGSQDYWFDFRQNFGDGLNQNGLQAHWANKDGNQSYLLDARPDQSGEAIAIGRTFADKAAGVYVTPLRRSSTSPRSIDVQVTAGTVAGNRKPVVTVAAPSLLCLAAQEQVYTAEATDPDGDTLAYYWETSDGNTYSTDNSPVFRHTFANAGEYWVQCTVSDMKGGTAADTVIVRPGDPAATFHLGGRVLDVDSRPVQGVKVFLDANRYAWTDSDGTYALTGLAAGTYTPTAREVVEDKTSFIHPFWTGAITVGGAAGSPMTADFTAYSGSLETYTTLIAKAATWKYLDDGTDQGTAWKESAFTETWSSGPGPLGYGNGGEGTIISYGPDSTNKRITYYFRKSLSLASVSQFTKVRLETLRDDGVVVYINGSEVYRDNLPTGTITAATHASAAVEPDSYQLKEMTLAESHLVAGTNVIAVEMHQSDGTSSDIDFDLALTGVSTGTAAGQTQAFITSPASQQVIATGTASVNIDATARAELATVTKVEFFDNGVKLGEDTVAPYSLAWTAPVAGAHSLTVTATFSLGNPVTSAPVSVTVADPPAVLVAAGSTGWRYIANGLAPPANWNQPAYTGDAASPWLGGAAQLGYGGNGEVTTIAGGPTTARYLAYYFRKTFTVADPAAVSRLLVRLVRDDGAVVYLNGREIMRSNMPAGTVDQTTKALVGAGTDPLEKTWYYASVDPSLLKPGTNVIAAEVHQADVTSSDVSFDLALEGVLSTARARGVYLNAPATASVPAVLTLTADAVPGGTLGVTKVEFFDGATKLGEATTPVSGASYTFTWTNPAAGSHSVTARLTDTASGTATSDPAIVAVGTTPTGTALVSLGEMWKYWDRAGDPGDWTGRTSYDDSTWTEGRARLGYGGDGEVTTIGYGPDAAAKYSTAYFRKKFTVADPAAFPGLRLRVLRDDAAVVYINRTEVYRDTNLPAGLLTFASLATSGVDAAAEQAFVEVIIPTTSLRAGENQIAVEVHQASIGSSDLSFELQLTGLAAAPSTVVSGVYLTSPTQLEKYIPTHDIPLTLYNGSGSAISRVDYYAGPALLGSSVVAPFSTVWTTPLMGTYSVTAKATLIGGAVVTTPAVTVSVTGAAVSDSPILSGASWSYLDDGSVPDAAWTTAAFTPASPWKSGATRLGFGGDGETTPALTSGHLTYYFRTTFEVPVGVVYSGVSIRLQRDDGILMRLNGTEIIRDNLPAGTLTPSTLSVLGISNADETAWLTFAPANFISSLRPGINVLTAEVHQSGPTSSDVAFNYEMTLTGQSTAGQSNTQPSVMPGLTFGPASPGSAATLLNLTFPETDGRLYLIECSESLSSWQPVDWQVVHGGRVTLPIVPNAPKRYYRAQWRAALP